MNEITVPSINPLLFCADVRASQDFLVEAFGLEPGPAHDGHAIAYLGTATVHLSTPHPGSMEPAGQVSVLHALVLSYVEDVDAVYRRARAAGAKVEYEVQDMPYGQRECGLRDLDGNLWSFATPN
ncbi:VOC family protein [Amycolatopsis aidingensis]|uniref:VOC family protein n=1 Tax=Amycolatopsis aidingensis TaxID=2842453 RepID=UPI001C0BB8AE|nr:VOC family protein [Amycolatopsis aidingensis]